MKQLKYYLMIMSAVFALGSCSDDDGSPVANNGADAEISLSADTVQVAKEGGDIAVTVTSSSDWRLAGTCEWAHPSVTEGANGAEVTFTVDPNGTEDIRTATFKFFTGATVAPFVIESHPDNNIYLQSEATIDLDKDDTEAVIKLTGYTEGLSIAYSEGSESWLSLGRQVHFMGETMVYINVVKNETYFARSATVSLTNSLSDEPVNITVNQAPNEFFEVTCESMEDNIIYCDMKGQDILFTMRTNIEYVAEITDGEEWLGQPQVSEPQTGEDGLSTYTITINVPEAQAARVGKVNIKAESERRDNEITIVQKSEPDQLVELSDDVAETALDNDWVMQIGEQYLVLEAGMNATAFEPWGSVSDLTGIENFPNLETLEFSCRWGMSQIDISGLHKVRELKADGTEDIEVFNFGDNPITSFNLGDGTDAPEVATIKFISTKLVTLNVNVEGAMDDWRWSYDVETIDVSECPALTTLEAEHVSENFSTIIASESQKSTLTTIKKPESVTVEYK